VGAALNSTIDLDGFTAAIDDGSNYPQYGGITRSDIATGANKRYQTLSTLLRQRSRWLRCRLRSVLHGSA